MNSAQFQDPAMLNWLWLLPGMILLMIYAARERQKALSGLIEAGVLDRLRMTVNPVRRRWKTILVLSALAFTVIALARPAWNPQPVTMPQKGRDVVFLLDVSRSMLAEDLAPNRLERAKLAIRDCVEKLQGDRAGLVVFAGAAVVKCPLTLDYGFFRLMLEDVSTDSVNRGGTLIGDGIRKCLDEVLDDQTKDFKDIILITDGEDHESFPVEAAKLAGERGVRLLAIGLGDEGEGRRIPIKDADGNPSFLTHDGQEVWSKLGADTLREMVTATPGGRYLNVATGAIDLGEVYQQLIVPAKKKDLEATTIQQFEEKFQIFLTLALVILGIEMVLTDRIRRE